MARVLVVDEEKGIRTTLEKFLLMEDHQVFLAESYEEATKHILDAKPDVVISDMLLNGKTGFDILKSIRQTSAGTKTIVISGHPEVDEIVQVMRLGAFDYFSKPVSREDLLNCVRDAAAKKQATDEQQKTFIEREHYIKTVIDNSPFQFCSFDTDLKIKLQNSKSVEVWGDLSVGGLDELDIEEDVKDYLIKQLNLVLLGETINYESSVIRNGEEMHFFNTLTPIMINGKINGIVAISEDITSKMKEKQEILRFANIMKSTGQGVIFLDLEGTILNVNDSALRIYGIPPSENIIGKNIFRLVPEAKLDIATERFKNASSGQRNAPYEYNIKTYDGADLPIEVSTSFLSDEDGNVFGVSLIFQDISERKAAENALRESEGLHKQLVNLIPEALVLTDTENRITFVSALFLEIFGYNDVSEVVGKSIFEMLPESIHDDIMESIVLTHGGIDVDDKTYPILKADGSKLWCHINADIFHDKDGSIKGIVAILRDLSERRKMENDLRNSEKRFRELAELLPEIVYEMDNNGILTFVNEEAYNITGYTREDIENGFAAVTLLVPEDRAKALEAIKKVMVGHENVPHHEYRAMRKDGTTFPVITRYSNIVRNGKIEGIRGIFFDLSEQKRAEEKQRELEKHLVQTRHLESLAQLAGGLAHDFNNLLTGILGNASLAKIDIPEDNPSYENLYDIEQAAESASLLVKRMLAYSGKGAFSFEQEDLSAIVKQSVMKFRPSLQHTIKLNVTLDDNLPPSLIDQVQFEQLINSLLVNASEAIESLGTISVRTGLMHFSQSQLNKMYMTQILKEGEYLYLEVEDDGKGFSVDDYERIFDPFYSTKFLGRGMGLAAVLGIVRGHGGAISVVSDPGEGSLFRVLFAPFKDKHEEDSEEISGKALNNHRTILVVDDEPLVLRLASKTFERAGYSVITATDGVEAVDIYKEHYQEISAILLDMTMPNKSGTETFNEMLAIDQSAKIILASGHTEEEIIKVFPTDKLSVFIHKPFKPPELLKVMEDFLAD